MLDNRPHVAVGVAGEAVLHGAGKWPAEASQRMARARDGFDEIPDLS
jgi:hypothetical protein